MQLTATKDWARRGPLSCMARANSSLPTPDSPCSSRRNRLAHGLAGSRDGGLQHRIARVQRGQCVDRFRRSHRDCRRSHRVAQRKMRQPTGIHPYPDGLTRGRMHHARNVGRAPAPVQQLCQRFSQHAVQLGLCQILPAQAQQDQRGARSSGPPNAPDPGCDGGSPAGHPTRPARPAGGHWGRGWVRRRRPENRCAPGNAHRHAPPRHGRRSARCRWRWCPGTALARWRPGAAPPFCAVDKLKVAKGVQQHQPVHLGEPAMRQLVESDIRSAAPGALPVGHACTCSAMIMILIIRVQLTDADARNRRIS